MWLNWPIWEEPLCQQHVKAMSIKGNWIVQRTAQQILQHYWKQLLFSITLKLNRKPRFLVFAADLDCYSKQRWHNSWAKTILTGHSCASGFPAPLVWLSQTNTPGVSLQGQAEQEGWRVCHLTDILLWAHTHTSSANKTSKTFVTDVQPTKPSETSHKKLARAY